MNSLSNSPSFGKTIGVETIRMRLSDRLLARAGKISTILAVVVTPCFPVLARKASKRESESSEERLSEVGDNRSGAARRGEKDCGPPAVGVIEIADSTAELAAAVFAKSFRLLLLVERGASLWVNDNFLSLFWAAASWLMEAAAKGSRRAEYIVPLYGNSALLSTGLFF